MKLSFFLIFFALFAVVASAATTLQVDLVSTDATIIDTGAGNSHPVFQIKVMVTPVGGDAYVPIFGGFTSAILGAPQGSLILTDSLACTPNAFFDESFRILEGQSYMFTHTTSAYSQSYTGFIRGDLQGIIWSNEPYGLPTSQVNYVGDFTTDYVFIQAGGSAPEPSRTLFVGLGLMILITKRRRK